MLVLITSCSYTPVTSFKDDIILQIIMRGLERSFSYTPYYSFSDEFYTPDATFTEEFLVHC